METPQDSKMLCRLPSLALDPPVREGSTGILRGSLI